jgi:hypothetical protein
MLAKERGGRGARSQYITGPSRLEPGVTSAFIIVLSQRAIPGNGVDREASPRA